MGKFTFTRAAALRAPDLVRHRGEPDPNVWSFDSSPNRSIGIRLGRQQDSIRMKRIDELSNDEVETFDVYGIPLSGTSEGYLGRMTSITTTHLWAMRR